ncbi:MAG: sugar phosphate isomerase/epimerase family protein, partial [Solirubrobacteraceae bacterium]
MTRPVTLFTGQWADLPLAELAKKATEWGFDGLELASSGDHFDVPTALADASYCRRHAELLDRNGLGCWAISAHLVGQAVCDPIDARHRAILPDEVWGDGDPEGVRERAAERLKDTARAAAQMGVTVVTGFTGSPIWHLLYSFPPNDFAALERGWLLCQADGDRDAVGVAQEVVDAAHEVAFEAADRFSVALPVAALFG